MDQASGGDAEIAPPAASRRRAEIQIVVMALKSLAQTTDEHEFSPADHSGGGGDGGDFACAGEGPHIPVAVGGEAAHDVVGGSTRPG